MYGRYGGEYGSSYPVHKLTDQSLLAEIARKGQNADARITAAGKQADRELAQSVYAEIVRTADECDVRRDAVTMLTDQSVLAEVAQNDPDGFIRLRASQKLHRDNKTALLEVVRSEIERADTNDQVVAYTSFHVAKQQLEGIAWSENSKVDKLAAIMNRFSICALCRDPVENRYLDEKGRCGSCSGAS